MSNFDKNCLKIKIIVQDRINKYRFLITYSFKNVYFYTTKIKMIYFWQNTIKRLWKDVYSLLKCSKIILLQIYLITIYLPYNKKIVSSVNLFNFTQLLFF